MRKFLLTVATFAVCGFTAQAQHMTLHEEFTGENCGPCAGTNPTFWALCDLAANASKLIHISYMVPIPSAGWYCNRTTAIYTARDAYYSVPFAPYGRYDGHVPDATMSSPGHPGYFLQADIDSESAVATPFTITVSNAWNANDDSIVTTVTVHCTSAWTGTTPYLRLALTHTDDFTTSPGSNGETHFENVVQAMYPDPTGTTVPATWAAGDTHVYTVTGAVPSWLDKSGGASMVAWLQDDGTKRIWQAAQATPLPPVTNDGAITGVTGPGSLTCVANGPYTLSHSVTIKNTGSATLTSATIYYSIDGGAFLSSAWTGSLATGATATYTMPTASITVSGALYHTVFDSLGKPNGVTDKNLINNTGGQDVFLESNNALALPYTTSFETVDLGKFDMMDVDNNGETWGIYNNGTGAALGHTGANAALFDCYGYAAGETDVMTLPKVASGVPGTLSFYTAHCPYSATAENDMLEVVYSTDCGSTWTSIWSKSGTALANLPLSTANFVPTSSQYVAQSTTISAIPAGAIIGFRGTSAYGNNIWVDDINIKSTVGVNQVNTSAPEMSIYPNPANEAATLSLNLFESSDVQIQVVDGLGRIVSQVANEKMDAGMHQISVNTSAMAAGVYNVIMHTDNGTNNVRLTVIK